jgi:hypothetical protein
MGKKYTDKELISELCRFVEEEGFIPNTYILTTKRGYIPYQAYIARYGSLDKALIVANLPLNQYHDDSMLDGTEVCCYCGKRADEIFGFRNWLYDNGFRYCEKHRRGPDYIKGTLDVNSATARGRIGEILVVKTLGIGKDHDCNRISCKYKFDLYNEQYGKIDVKTSKFSIKNMWTFNFNKKQDADTYICIGLSSDRKNVLHVWIVPNEGQIKNLTGLGISNKHVSLLNNSKWEVDSKPYDDALHSMSLDNCKIMVDKSNYV